MSNYVPSYGLALNSRNLKMCEVLPTWCLRAHILSTMRDLQTYLRYIPGSMFDQLSNHSWLPQTPLKARRQSCTKGLLTFVEPVCKSLGNLF
jgi:hypothetical protein